MTSRLHGLDIIRGLAVFLMLIFHFVYDLTLFGHLPESYRQGFWFALPRFIVFLFLWCVGASLEIAHARGINYRIYLQRVSKLIIIAAAISAMTYYFFPGNWIYFGTIHCIAAVSVMALPFFYWRWARFPAFLLILAGQFLMGYDIEWAGAFFPGPTMDFIPAYPWFWVVLLGLMTGPKLLHRWHPLANPLLGWLGRHALPIYLTHQALFYAVFTLLTLIKTKT